MRTIIIVTQLYNIIIFVVCNTHTQVLCYGLHFEVSKHMIEALELLTTNLSITPRD